MPREPILPKARARSVTVKHKDSARAKLSLPSSLLIRLRAIDDTGGIFLFVGASGTGKTMAAQAIASDLGRSLQHIDLASIISKYAGETEAAIDRMFDAAKKASAILLFDEADAIFGRRSEVRDAHDRYANLEVSYLLARFEDYPGIVIVKSRNKSALDPAFIRRLRHMIDFPTPKPNRAM